MNLVEFWDKGCTLLEPTRPGEQRYLNTKKNQGCAMATMAAGILERVTDLFDRSDYDHALVIAVARTTVPVELASEIDGLPANPSTLFDEINWRYETLKHDRAAIRNWLVEVDKYYEPA